MKISNNSVVSINYTLKNDKGEILDSCEGQGPMPYIHGTGNIIPGLEKELSDKEVGAKIVAVIPPEEAYGQLEEGLVQVVPLADFDNKDEVKVGIQFHAQTSEDSASIATIVKVEGEEVTIDLNHPLAGETLHFDVEVVDIRAATEEELAHGHVHGPGGHEH